jgi:hypothetical protein
MESSKAADHYDRRLFVLLAMMELFIKRTLTLFLLACVITGVGFGVTYGLDVYHQAVTREVGLESEPGYYGMDDSPMSVLASALPENRLAAKFRVKWSDVHPGLSVEGWLLYDRRQSTLQFNNHICSGDTEGKTVCSDSAYAFASVTDGIVTRLASADVANLPKLLPMYGRHVRKSKSD